MIETGLMILCCSIIVTIISIGIRRIEDAWYKSSVLSANPVSQLPATQWDDPEYVSMIHRTITLEKENLGGAVTKCECSNCTAPPRTPVDKGTVGKSRWSAEIEGTSQYRLQEKPKTNHWNIEGYEFDILDSVVPSHAYGIFDHGQKIGLFTWIDHATGERKALRTHPNYRTATARFIDTDDIEIDQLFEYTMCKDCYE